MAILSDPLSAARLRSALAPAFGPLRNRVPRRPRNLVATAGDTDASIVFDAPTSDGGSAITGYTVTSIPAGGTDDDGGETGLTHVVSGLTNDTEYTFTVTATNAIGTSAASAPSNAVTPESSGYALPDPAPSDTLYNPDFATYEFANAWPASGFIIAPGLVNIALSSFQFVAGQCPPIEGLDDLDVCQVTNFPLATGYIPNPGPNMTDDYEFSECPGVTAYEGGDFPSTIANIIFSGCALPDAEINKVLAAAVAGGVNGATIDLTGALMGEPTGQGLTDKTTLEGDGCTVDTN